MHSSKFDACLPATRDQLTAPISKTPAPGRPSRNELYPRAKAYTCSFGLPWAKGSMDAWALCRVNEALSGI